MSTELTVLPASGNAGGGAIVDFEYGSVTDLRKKLADMKQKLNLTREFFREVMQEGIDYGIIPGTDKPTLYKPGAEGLCEFYNFAPTIASKVEEKNIDTGYYAVDITIRLVHRSTGTIIGEGVGHANTYENRYRWRWVGERDLPKGINKDDLPFKEYDGQYGKYRKYRMDNDDMFSIWNTVLKMSKKRALVDATLQATRSSGIFAQTEAELDAYLNGEDPEGEPDRERQRPQQSRQSSGRNGGSSGQRSSGGAVSKKNRAIKLVEQHRGGADWNWLAERASEALFRPIKKVIQEVKDAEWKTVADYLEHYGEGDGQSSMDLDDDTLPPELRGER